MVESVVKDKLGLIIDFEAYLTGLGMSKELVGMLSFFTLIVVLILGAWLLNIVFNKVMIVVIKRSVKKTKTMFDDFLVEHGFFRWLTITILFLVVIASIETLFSGYSMALIRNSMKMFKCITILTIIKLLSSVLNSIYDLYQTKPQAQKKSIKGYIQIIKITIYVIAGIAIISVLLGTDFNKVILAMGASAAVITLVFKDVILGLVASIQLSAQDMVRPGDWIEIPSKNANGTVVDMNINTVKVKNWDNTMTMVPIYSLVSESFTNWRTMQQSSGRQIKRSMYIDVYSVKFVEEQTVKAISENSIVEKYSEQMLAKAKEYNTGENLTNLGLFRSYSEVFLLNHNKINTKLPMAVRYTSQQDNGIGMELYCFSKEKDMYEFEKVISDIFEHLIAIAPIFEISIYQRPSGNTSK